ncbi:MAG: hypothetical protein IKH94_08615, partial [Eubacterium sp.]|nr:hypothetical protein [Eubacterium sp.]
SSEGRPAKKIFPGEQKKTRILRLQRYKDQSLARFSNIYMIAGIVIGLLVFYFLISPDLKSDYEEKVRELETSYNQTISTKNNQIENLNLEVEGLTTKNTDYAAKQSAMEKKIESLNSEVDILKQTVESGGMVAPDMSALTNPEDDTQGVSTSSTGVTRDENAANSTNAAAERNNANIIGIDTDSIEGIINNE